MRQGAVRLAGARDRELRDRHELVAGRVRALDDLGHGLDGLAAVVALAAAVGVVQQEDAAGPEAADRAPHDRLGAGLGRVPDALRPAHHLVAAARGHARDEGIAEAVRGAEEQRVQLPAERGRERGLRALELALDVRLRGERQQRVVVAVRRDLVALLAHAADQLGVLPRRGGRARRRSRARRSRAARRARAASIRRTARRRRSGRARGRACRARSATLPKSGELGVNEAQAQIRTSRQTRAKNAQPAQPASAVPTTAATAAPVGDHHGRGADEAPDDRALPHPEPRLRLSSSS